MTDKEKKEITYLDAGVDIDAAARAKEMMKESVKASYRPEVLGELGAFGGFFAFDTKKGTGSGSWYRWRWHQTEIGFYG